MNTAVGEAEERAEKRGRRKGRREGKRKATLDIARNLLDTLDDEAIATKTGLTVEEVAKLRAESKK